MAATPTTPFFIQFAEALGSISVPIGGGLVAFAKWRKSAERDRRAREEAARIASERAAADARKEEQDMRDRLIAEKDSAIARLNNRVETLMKENSRLHQRIEELLEKGISDAR